MGMRPRVRGGGGIKFKAKVSSVHVGRLIGIGIRIDKARIGID